MGKKPCKYFEKGEGMCQLGRKCLWKEVLQGTKGLKEVTRFCRNVRFSEQLLCIVECTTGYYSFPKKVTASTLWQTKVFVSLSAELFPCSDSSMAVSTPVKAAAFAALFKPSQVKIIMRQKFPYKLHQSCGVFHFSPCGCCFVCAALGMFTAWSWLSRTEGHKWQEATVIMSKPAFPQEPGASQIVSESTSGLFLVLPSCFCTPHPCCECSSHFPLTVPCSSCSGNL